MIQPLLPPHIRNIDLLMEMMKISYEYATWITLGVLCVSLTLFAVDFLRDKQSFKSYYHSDYLHIAENSSLKDTTAWGQTRRYIDRQGASRLFNLFNIPDKLCEDRDELCMALNDERKYLETLMQHRINFCIVLIVGWFTIAITLIDKSINFVAIVTYLLIGRWVVSCLANYIDRIQCKLNLYLALLFKYNYPIMVFVRQLIDSENPGIQENIRTGKELRLNDINARWFVQLYALSAMIVVTGSFLKTTLELRP